MSAPQNITCDVYVGSALTGQTAEIVQKLIEEWRTLLESKHLLPIFPKRGSGRPKDRSKLGNSYEQLPGQILARQDAADASQRLLGVTDFSLDPVDGLPSFGATAEIGLYSAMVAGGMITRWLVIPDGSFYDHPAIKEPLHREQICRTREEALAKILAQLANYSSLEQLETDIMAAIGRAQASAFRNHRGRARLVDVRGQGLKGQLQASIEAGRAIFSQEFLVILADPMFCAAGKERFLSHQIVGHWAAKVTDDEELARLWVDNFNATH